MELRGTGRSTACCLQAIANALLQPDEWVFVIDHGGDRVTGIDHWFPRTISRFAKQIGLTIDVEVIKGSVRIKSPVARMLIDDEDAETAKNIGLTVEQFRDSRFATLTTKKGG